MADIFRGTPFQFGAWAQSWQRWPNMRVRFTGDLPDPVAEVVSMSAWYLWGTTHVDAIALPDGTCELRMNSIALTDGVADSRLEDRVIRKGKNIWRQCLLDLLTAGLLKTTVPAVNAGPGVKGIRNETRRRAELAMEEKAKDSTLSRQGTANRLNMRRQAAKAKNEDLGIGDKELTADDINYAVGEMRRLEPDNPKWRWRKGDPTFRRR